MGPGHAQAADTPSAAGDRRRLQCRPQDASQGGAAGCNVRPEGVKERCDFSSKGIRECVKDREEEEKGTNHNTVRVNCDVLSMKKIQT